MKPATELFVELFVFAMNVGVLMLHVRLYEASETTGRTMGLALVAACLPLLAAPPV